MFARLVLSYILVLPAIVPLVADFAVDRPYTLLVRMAATGGGQLQAFYDTGNGYTEAQSVTVALRESDRPSDYRLRLPPGRYRGLRLDPGMSPGLYVIERAVILAENGAVQTTIPLNALTPVQQLAVLERSNNRLRVEAPPGSNDPILVYSPQSPILLKSDERSRAWLLCRVALWWICGIVLVWAVEQLPWPLDTVRSGMRAASIYGRGRPRTAVLVGALLGTILATYPILLAGRSLASPNTGGTLMLYDQAPFVPGSSDLEIEDVRGSDAGAMMWQSVPHSHVERDALADAEIPLWNRYNAVGRPLWGQGLSYMLDPLHWLTLVIPDLALAWDLKFVAHRFVFALGVGLAALAATGAWVPSVIAAAAAPFAGVYGFRLNHPAVFVLSYAPWVLLAWFSLAGATDQSKRARASILLAVSSSLVLVAAPPKEGVVTLLSMEVAGLLAVLLWAGSWQHRAWRLMFAVAAGVAMVLLTAPHWLIFLETLRASAGMHDIPYVNFAGRQLALALFLGPLSPGPLSPGAHVLALILTIAALAEPSRLARKPAVFACVAVAAALLAIAFGVVPAAWLLRIPLLGQIGHVGHTFLTAVVPLLMVLCAEGFRVLLQAGTLRTTIVGVLTGVACLLLVALALVVSPPVHWFELPVLPLLLPIAVALPLCLLVARRGSRALPWVAVTASSCLLLLPGGLHLRSGMLPLDSLLIQPRPRSALDQPSPAVSAIHDAAVEPSRTVGLDLVLFPGTQALYDLEGIGGADALEVPAYRELVDAAGVTRPWGWYWLTVVGVNDLTRLRPLLDLVNVEFLLTRSDNAPSGFVEIPLQGTDRLRAFRRPTAWPRAFFVDAVTTYLDPRDLLRQVSERGRPFAAIQLDDKRAVEAARGLFTPANTAPVAAHDYTLTANTTRFRVRASGPGVAVLGETYLPEDFVATLNGKAVPYFRVDHVFKAVRIPSAGDWEVRFQYRPKHWTLAWLLAAMGALMILGLAATWRRGEGSSYAYSVTTKPSAGPLG